MKFSDYIRKFDFVLLGSVFLLVSAGLSAIYSVNLGASGNFYNFKKQLVFSLIGMLFLFVFSAIDYRIYKSYVALLYISGVVLLGSVFLWGSVIRGTRGWFKFGVVNIQPVEIIKMIVIIFLAYYFTRWARHINYIRHIVLSGFGVFVFFILVFAQPDFGSAILLFLLWFILLFIIGLKKTYLILLSTLFISIGIFMWSFGLHGYQKDRLAVFLNPASDPLGSGYNLMQSLIATGAGGLWGRGLGFGSQSQLKFLPESQTDFIFAVIAEELGLVGILLILSFYAILLYRMYHIIRRGRDDFAVLLVLGIAVLLFIQLVINIGMNLGVMPVTGISLPFVSYGGSSLIVSMIMMGIVENICIVSKNYA